MKAIEFILHAQEDWFGRIKPYLLDSNLNVGSGHGYFSAIAGKAGFAMTSLEVAAPDTVLNPQELILYDGGTMPFADNAYRASLAMYVLHHTPSPEAILEEMKRVSQRRIILVEELYRHIPGKIGLAALDFSVNFRAGLKSNIHWDSYLTEPRLLKAVQRGGWQIVHKESTPRTGFDEVLWVMDKSDA